MSYSEFAEFHNTISATDKQGSYSGRFWVEGTSPGSTIEGSVQPTDGRKIEGLNIGRADLGKMVLRTDAVLKIATQGQTGSGSVIVWEGERWEVIARLSWHNNIIEHYEYIIEYRGLVT